MITNYGIPNTYPAINLHVIQCQYCLTPNVLGGMYKNVKHYVYLRNGNIATSDQNVDESVFIEDIYNDIPAPQQYRCGMCAFDLSLGCRIVLDEKTLKHNQQFNDLIKGGTVIDKLLRYGHGDYQDLPTNMKDTVDKQDMKIIQSLF